jgi:hypothetical protein
MREVTRNEYCTYLERFLGKILPTPTSTDGVCWQHVGTQITLAEKQHHNGQPVYYILA